MASPTPILPKELEDPLSYLPCSTITEFSRGQSLYHQSQPSAHLYLVLSGHVKVSRLDNDGNQLLMDIYGPEEFFGETAILGASSNTEQATALERTRVMAWPTTSVEEVMLKKPRFGVALLQIVTGRAEGWKRRIESLAAQNILHRLASALMRFGERLGETQADGSVRLMPLSHEILAQYVGTSREIVTHYMTDFRRAGHLTYSRKHITLAPSFSRLAASPAQPVLPELLSYAS